MPISSISRSAFSCAVALSLLGTFVSAQEKLSPAIPASTASQTESAKAGLKIERTREDFTSIGLAGSDLVADAPIPGGHEENQDYIRDLVRVQWRMGDPIDLYIMRPAGVKNPPVALYLLSYPTAGERFMNPSLCKRLTENGAAAVGFVSALTGERFSRRPFKQWFVSELQESLAASTHDVQMVLNYLEQRGDMDMSRVGIFGQGSGAAIAVLAAAADPRIKALDLITPWGDWPDFMAESPIVPEDERPSYLRPEFLQKAEAMEPVRYLPALKGRAIRIQFLDDKPPRKFTAGIEKALPAGVEIHHYASTDELRSASGGRLFQWIGDQLKAGAGSSSAASAHVPAQAGKEGARH